jgi:hypothetical protein
MGRRREAEIHQHGIDAISDSKDRLKHIVGFARQISACSDASTEIHSRQVTGSDVSTESESWICSRQPSKQHDGSFMHMGRAAQRECNEANTASLLVQEPIYDAMRHNQTKLDSPANEPTLSVPDAHVLCEHTVPQKVSSTHVMYTAGSSVVSSFVACFTCLSFVLHAIANFSNRSCDNSDSDESDNDSSHAPTFQEVYCYGEKARIFQWQDEDGELQWAYVDASGELIQ